MRLQLRDVNSDNPFDFSETVRLAVDLDSKINTPIGVMHYAYTEPAFSVFEVGSPCSIKVGPEWHSHKVIVHEGSVFNWRSDDYVKPGNVVFEAVDDLFESAK